MTNNPSSGCHPSNRWVLSCKQQIIAISKVCNVNNMNVLEHKIVVFSLVATATTLEVVVTPPSYQRHEPTIEHKYSLLESKTSTRPRYLLATESMQDHKQHRDDKSLDQFDKVPIFIGSQQTQHVELHNDDLDHDRQLTRSKHEAHGGEDTI
jgi:hypothetical protein